MKKHLFNKTLFKASFKSNYISYLIVTIGNAFILLVVILIMSTLSINVTRDSMANMFNSAGLERRVKEAGVSLYLSYTGGIQIFDNQLSTFSNNIPNIVNEFSIVIKLGNGTYNNLLTGLKSQYQKYFDNSNFGSASEKHEDAKKKCIEESNFILEIARSNEETKKALEIFVGYFLDEYFKGDSSATENALSMTVNNLLDGFDSITDNQKNIVKKYISKAYKSKITNIELNNYVTKLIDEMSDEIVNNSYDFFTIDIPTEILIDGYFRNNDAYIKNAIINNDTIGYRDILNVEVVSQVVGNIFKDNYYLEALPTFKVEYLTNECGIPYYVEGGKEILITDKTNANKLVEVKNGMEKKANILEKQYKEILTGTDYTAEEIDRAKKDSLQFYDLGYKFAKRFFSNYIINKDDFIKNNILNKENIIIWATNDLKEFAQKYILDMFNVSSIEEITKDKYGLDGKEILGKIYDYTTGSVSIFESEYHNCINKRYDIRTSILVSLVKASDTLTDQLPEDIYIKLYDLSSRNLYGLVIGAMFFSLAGLLLPIVYTILTSNSLISEEVETGSMAFTLSCPVNRKSIVFTKAIYQISMLIIMFLFLFCMAVFTRQVAIWTGGTDFATSVSIVDLFQYTLGSFMVVLAISSICFFTSCFFNKTKLSLGVGGGLAIFFYVTSILGLFGMNVMPLALKIDSMNVFNYFTIIRLFDVQAVLDSNPLFYYKLLGLLFVTICCYGSAFYVFTKKDLPL